ncbi:DMT family transporter [Parendozoicomonas sp. Alg238-R29]|uniref:DMT family transporter n=1 Tax=Parendozoicomonas sp. Alg238-R29 TaxID=2993446 RepID=UPI00248E00F3|nr:DMT family transporter [Parendozoicomonas sp. Alg238-R29]
MNIMLYAATVLIWGTTWIAIKLQLGEVAISASIFYRFLIASCVLMFTLKLTGKLQAMTLQQHASCLMLGVLLFSVNFVFFYSATQYIVSGLSSVIFSMATVMNMANGYLFYRHKPTPRLITGAALGITGVLFLFWQDLSVASEMHQTLLGMGLAAAGTLCFSFGNMLSAKQQKQGFSVFSVNAWGMFYGAGMLATWTVLQGVPFTISTEISYLGSLFYLAIPGSVIAFSCYLLLVGRIGPQKAAYSTVLFPLVALGISTVYESYEWSLVALAGVALVVVGNILVFYQGNIKELISRNRAVNA